MEKYDDEDERAGASVPASPNAEFYNTSSLSVAIVAVMEMELPYDRNFPIIECLKYTLLPINARFSSIMVERENSRRRKWKPVRVNVENHLKFADYPEDKPVEFYDECLKEYLEKMMMEGFRQDQPLWEIHIFKYPSSKASWNLIYKLHHSLGDGYSLVGFLISAMKRHDDPSLPFTFPSRRPSQTQSPETSKISFFKRIPGLISGFLVNTVKDFSSSFLRSTILDDGENPIRSGKRMLELSPVNISTVEFSLDEIKNIKNSLGVKINDVIMGIIFLGIRLYMKEKDTATVNAGANSLVVFNARSIEVSYKSVEEMEWGNQFGFFHLPIPKMKTGEDDDESTIDTIKNPLSFVMQTHRTIKKKRDSAAAFLTSNLLQTMFKLKGSEVPSKYLYSALKNSSLLASNVIGPMEKMVLAKHPIKGLLYTLTGIPQSLAITMISYMGILNVAFRTEQGYIDPDLFISCIRHGYHIILKATPSN